MAALAFGLDRRPRYPGRRELARVAPDSREFPVIAKEFPVQSKEFPVNAA